jgi:hypothetical protein
MAYVCSPPCQFSSSARAGLTLHQAQCAIYRIAQTLWMEHRKAHKLPNNLPISTLGQRKERLEVRRPINMMVFESLYLHLLNISQNRGESASASTHSVGLDYRNIQVGSEVPNISNVPITLSASTSTLTTPPSLPEVAGPISTQTGRPRRNNMRRPKRESFTLPHIFRPESGWNIRVRGDSPESGGLFYVCYFHCSN